ncbi:hypothetical protein GW17_00059315 [Ensete ventricosum]|nr:hypothetical protein GW17_00059315 [Ensete ventricosum]
MLFAVSDESHPQLSGARADATYSYIVKVSTRTPVSTRHKDRVQAPVSAPAPTPPGSNCAGGCHVLGSSPVNACLETGFRLLGSSPVVGSAREVDCWGGRARVRRRLHRVSALLVSGRPYDRWRAHTCARLASRVGLATSAGRCGGRVTIYHIILPPPREDLLEVPDEGAEDEVLCLAAWPVVALG